MKVLLRLSIALVQLAVTAAVDAVTLLFGCLFPDLRAHSEHTLAL